MGGIAEAIRPEWLIDQGMDNAAAAGTGQQSENQQNKPSALDHLDVLPG